MKINHRPYEKESLCYGCKKVYWLNNHLLNCKKVKEQNENILIEIKDTIEKHNLDYSLSKIFEDYGLKDLVRKVRMRTI